jgi:hypothetical protein
MAKPSKDQSRDFDPGLNNAMMAFNPAMMQAWQKMMTECSRFIMYRLQKDMATQRDILSCKSPAELLRIQTEFYESALRDYSEETMRLFQTASDAASESVTAATAAKKRGYDDVPL